MSFSLKPQALNSHLKAGHEPGFIVLLAVHVSRPSSLKYDPGHLCLSDNSPFVGVNSTVTTLMDMKTK